MKIQVLGPGCAKCKKLAEHAETAARELSIDFMLEKVTDIDSILDFGVMTTPCLVLDGKVVTVGKIPSVEDIKKLIQKLAHESLSKYQGESNGD